jgi:hypothetical protein
MRKRFNPVNKTESTKQMNTRHRPPLTKEHLRAIGPRNKSPERNELLWELHRLRAIFLRADQLQRSLGQLGARN